MLQNLILNMLEKDPKNRPNAQLLLEESFPEHIKCKKLKQ